MSKEHICAEYNAASNTISLSITKTYFRRLFYKCSEDRFKIHLHAVPCPYFPVLIFFISVQLWKRSHGTENYVKAVLNEDVF